MDKLTIFIERLNRIGVTVELFGNYPWIYLNKVNNIKVTETFKSDYGFTIAFAPVRIGDELQFTDISEMFKLIRKYLIIL